MSVLEQVVNYFSATTDLICETNIGRRSKHQELCRFTNNDPELYIILKTLKIGTFFQSRRYRALLIMRKQSPIKVMSSVLQPC